MKPTQEQVIAWAREVDAYEAEGDDENETVWLLNQEELQAAFALAYEAGRKDENEACEQIVAYLLKMPENDISAMIRRRREQ